jgi:hypothetical protein
MFSDDEMLLLELTEQLEAVKVRIRKRNYELQKSSGIHPHTEFKEFVPPEMIDYMRYDELLAETKAKLETQIEEVSERLWAEESKSRDPLQRSDDNTSG